MKRQSIKAFTGKKTSRTARCRHGGMVAPKCACVRACVMCAYIADVSSPSKRGAAMMNAGNYFMRKMSFINVSLFW